MRVHELAKELNLKSQEIIDALSGTEHAVSSHSSSIDEVAQQIVRNKFKNKGKTIQDMNEKTEEKKQAVPAETKTEGKTEAKTEAKAFQLCLTRRTASRWEPEDSRVTAHREPVCSETETDVRRIRMRQQDRSRTESRRVLRPGKQ